MAAKHGLRSGFLGRAIIAALAIATLSTAGCYSNWPPIEGSGQTEVNNMHTRGALAEAGRWALRAYKPASPVAFNLPKDLRRSGVLEVIGAIGGGSVALTPETAASHTVYHLARVWIRNDTASLDVIVPTGQNAEGPTYTMTQLRLVGRGSSWRVEVAREWETLVRPIPELSYLPDTEYPAQTGEPEPMKHWPEE